MFFDYYLAMMMASVLLIFSPIIRILSEEVKSYIFDFGSSDEEEDSYL